MSRWLILVPARYGSSRFPGKPLAKINNKPMIHYMVQNCQDSGLDYAIVTDNDEIVACVNDIQGQVVRVDDDVPSGSERIALAYQRFFADKNYDYVINVQGDEPLLKGDIIKKLAKDHAKTDFDILTAVKKRKSSEADFNNPNVVKAVLSEKNNQCLYFSRQSIPKSRDGHESEWYQHVGFYSYKTKALLDFVKWPESHLEKLEKLEQLRALENGLSIGASEINIHLLGVDTPEDIQKIQGVLGE